MDEIVKWIPTCLEMDNVGGHLDFAARESKHVFSTTKKKQN